MANINIDQEIVGVSLHKSVVADKELVKVTDVKLPEDAPARMKTLKSEGKKWYLTVVYYPNTETPFALFCHTNNTEKTAQTSNAQELLVKLARDKGILEEHINTTLEKCKQESNVGKLTRTISLLLRHGVSIVNIVSTLEEVEDVFVGSFLFQIKKFLQQYVQDGEEVQDEKCSSCGGTLIFSEGCMMCRDCGASKCG